MWVVQGSLGNKLANHPYHPDQSFYRLGKGRS